MSNVISPLLLNAVGNFLFISVFTTVGAGIGSVVEHYVSSERRKEVARVYQFANAALGATFFAISKGFKKNIVVNCIFNRLNLPVCSFSPSLGYSVISALAFASLGALVAKAKSPESKLFLERKLGNIVGGGIHGIVRIISLALDVTAKVVNVAMPIILAVGLWVDPVGMLIVTPVGTFFTGILLTITIANLAKRIFS